MLKLLLYFCTEITQCRGIHFNNNNNPINLMNKFLLFSALLSAGLTMTAATDNKVDVTVGDWVFAGERFDEGVSISEITTTGSNGAVDFSTATFSNTDGENKIFNIRPRVFRGCTALTSITLPASLESFMPMAADEFFSTDLVGDGTNRFKTLEKAFGNADFELNATVTFNSWAEAADKTSFLTTKWGCCILATGTDPGLVSYPNGFQLYLQNPNFDGKDGSLLIKVNNTEKIIPNTVDLINTCNGKFSIKIVYNHAAKTLSVWVDDATEAVTFNDITIGTVSALSTNINSNVHMVAAITEPKDVSTAEVENPFRGCVNLMNFYVETGNTIFTVGPNGALRKNGEVKAYPYGRLFDKYLRFNVTDENGNGTGVYLNSGVSCNAAGQQLTGIKPIPDGGRQFIFGQGKTGSSLFMFKYFPETPNLSISIEDINASYGDTSMWGAGKGNQPAQINWESTGNRDWSAQIGMSVVPGRAYVTFYITTTNSNGTYYVTYSEKGAILTADKEKATEFAIEFAEFIEVPLTDGYATACLPVAVTAQLNDGQHISDNVVVSDNKVVLKPMTGNSIAARTPIIISSENDQTTPEVVTFKIADANTPAPAAEGEASSLLKGYSLPCTALTATDSYGISGTNFVQTTKTGACSVIIAKPADATWAETLTIDASETTGIKEVESAAAAKPAAIYDLQGRRVSNASNGIFIINGVKTLVK